MPDRPSRLVVTFLLVMSRIAGLWFCLFYCFPAMAAAADVRITLETGFHTAAIRSMAVDPEGHYAVTVGDDHVARLFRLPGGQRMRILRPPQDGEGQSGRLWSVAISSDGSLIALGGHTRVQDSGNQHPVHLFSPDGHLLKQLQGAVNPVAELAFNSTGEYVAGCQQGGVLSVWKIGEDEQAPPWQQTTGNGDCRGLVWTSDNRLLTSNTDGMIKAFRVHANRLEGSGQFIDLESQHPGRLALSHDKKKLAVGLDNGVILLDPNDLKKLSSQSAGLPAGVKASLASVAWSKDGAKICAAGQAIDSVGRVVLWCWEENGAKEIPVGQDSVTALAASPEGFLAATATPEVLQVGSSWAVKRLAGGMSMDFRHLEVFQVNGSTLMLKAQDKATARKFDATQRSLEEVTPTETGLRVAPGDTLINKCKNVFREPSLIKVNDALTLPSSGNLACAGSAGVWLVDGKNTLVRRLSLSAEVYALAAGSKPNQLLAGVGDGTVRWLQGSELIPILSLYLVRGRSHWVAWTPSGYYDASPGAENLFGWEVWRGGRRPMDFFAAGRFRDERYRPGIAAAILQEGSEAAGLKRLNAGSSGHEPIAPVQAKNTPPQIELLDEPDVPCTPRGCIVRFRAQGSPTQASWKIPAAEEMRFDLEKGGLERFSQHDIYSFVIPAVQKVQPLRISVQNATGLSAKVEANLLPYQKGETHVRPSLHLLAVGADVPQGEEMPALYYAGDDARSIVDVFTRQKGGGVSPFADVNATVLDGSKGNRPDRKSILQAIERLRQANIGSGDLVLIFLAGHGIKDKQGRYYFWTADAKRDALGTTALSGEDLQRALTGLPSRVMLWIDTCHSGGAIDHMGWIASLLDQSSRLTVLSAAMGQQSSQEDARWATRGYRGHGAFTRAILEAMERAGDPERTQISFKDIDAYVSRRVPELTNRKQTPLTPLNLSEDIALVIRKH